ncbi:hypothetical protein ACFS32_10115 [Novosphingobium pokkalii]|uniref:hypothetical protein n=1 Tax=Novosphingobium pokkalii TaxID=1770194 RepID=UPI003640E632
MTGAMLRRLIASLLVSLLLALPAAPALADPADIAAASRGWSAWSSSRPKGAIPR